MSHSVFISYARDASRTEAEAIYHALGGAEEDICFLDTKDIGTGEPFPERLVDELFGARVVVILAEPTYFTRRYCLQEFHIASGPFSRLLEGSRPTEKQKEEALRGIVVALPERGVDPMMERFPAKIAGRNWPRADQADEIAALVRAELALNPPTLRERYAALGADEETRALFLSKSALPTPLRIGSIPTAPVLRIPISIGDAFVGRADDLWRIHDVLTSQRGDLWTAAGITGSIEAGGGFGKTRIAVEYLYRFGTRSFQGGLFWIEAEQDPEDRLYEILVALNPSADPIEVVRKRPGSVAAAVARAIRGLPQDSPPPLFIIDNVPEPVPGESPKPLETWCPVPGEVSVLATSRTQVALSGGRVEAVRIDVLDREAAIDLISAGVSGLSRDGWGEIAEWVGYLPLALELLNRALRAGALSQADALNAAVEGSATTLPLENARDALRGVVPEGAVRGVSQAFALSYDRLTPDQRTAARLLAWMAPAPIPTLVLKTFEQERFTSSIRAVLRSRSIVTDVGDADSEYFGMMHAVLADFLLSQSESLLAEARVVTTALLNSLRVVRGTGDPGAAYVRRCIAVVSAVLDRLFRWHAGDEWTELVYDLGNPAGTEFAQWWGMPMAAGMLFEKLFRFAETELESDNPRTLNAMNDLAGSMGSRGDFAGAQRLLESLVEMLGRSGENTPEFLRALGNLALVLAHRGDLAKAAGLLQRLISVRQRNLGTDHHDTLAAMLTLARVVALQGELESAETILIEILEKSRRLRTPNARMNLNVMQTLTWVFSLQGDLARAIKSGNQLLDFMRETFGEQHSDTIVMMQNISSNLLATGDLERAYELGTKALEHSRAVHGPRHPHTCEAAWNIVLILDRRGDPDGVGSIILANDLMWLLDADESLLSPNQVKIKEQLGRMFADQRLQ